MLNKVKVYAKYHVHSADMYPTFNGNSLRNWALVTQRRGYTSIVAKAHIHILSLTSMVYSTVPGDVVAIEFLCGRRPEFTQNMMRTTQVHVVFLRRQFTWLDVGVKRLMCYVELIFICDEPYLSAMSKTIKDNVGLRRMEETNTKLFYDAWRVICVRKYALSHMLILEAKRAGPQLEISADYVRGLSSLGCDMTSCHADVAGAHSIASCDANVGVRRMEGNDITFSADADIEPDREGFSHLRRFPEVFADFFNSRRCNIFTHPAQLYIAAFLESEVM
ncbi:hypothetical protein Tco_0344609 [Tanacetum coccineum]